MPLILLVILVAGLGWFWVRSRPPAQRASAGWLAMAIGLLVLLGLLLLSGRYPIAIALLAAVLPFLGRLLRRSSAQPQAGNQSRVTSDILEMVLDHDSGTMQGSVLSGAYAGRQLADLAEAEFLALLRYCRAQDEDSARLLETYLDRRFGDSWRADDVDGDEASSSQSTSAETPLGEAEALDILGLKKGASRDEIIQAHRRLMQKVHPDRGGSTYLAARVNQAKKCLLG